MDLAGDGVAAYAQLLSRLDAAPAGVDQRGLNQLGLEAACEHVPDVGLTADQQGQGFGFQVGFLAAGGHGGPDGLGWWGGRTAHRVSRCKVGA